MLNLAFALPLYFTALRTVLRFSLALLLCAALPNLYAATLANTLGQQNTLVVLVNFQDQPANKPYTTTAVTASVFGQASDFFYENSYHQTWLSGTVAGWYTLALSSTSCDTNAIQQQGKQAASAAGFNLASYQRFVFIFPQNAACGFSGLGDIGLSPSNTWINGSIDYKIIAHEIGHNFGLTHAGSLDCGTDALSGSCTPSVKSHMLDIMGSLSAGHFNAQAKERLGWLNSSNMQTVESSGSYSMASAEALDGGIKALKVKRGIEATTGATTWYYLEARKAQGHDSFLATYSNATQGISFSTTHASYPGEAFQLDMTPNSLGWGDFEDAALTTGNTFTDATTGASFTTDYVNSTGAGVTVILGGATTKCTTALPSLRVLTTSVTAAAGATANYMVEVQNNNSSGCANSTMNLAAVVPSGWSASWSLSSFALASGQTETVIMSVTSAASATAGSYSLPVSATSTAGNTSTTAIYSVTSVANTAPQAVNDVVIISSKVATKINVLANDSDAEGSKLTITSVAGATKGTAIINSDGTVSYTPGKAFKTADSFSYTISDGSKTATATVSISLQTAKR